MTYPSQEKLPLAPAHSGGDVNFAISLPILILVSVSAEKAVSSRSEPTQPRRHGWKRTRTVKGKLPCLARSKSAETISNPDLSMTADAKIQSSDRQAPEGRHPLLPLLSPSHHLHPPHLFLSLSASTWCGCCHTHAHTHTLTHTDAHTHTCSHAHTHTRASALKHCEVLGLPCFIWDTNRCAQSFGGVSVSSLFPKSVALKEGGLCQLIGQKSKLRDASSEITLVKFTQMFSLRFLSRLNQISIKREKKRKIKSCHDHNSYKSPDSINPGLVIVQQRRNNWLQTRNFSLEIRFDGVIMKRAVNTNYTYDLNIILSTFPYFTHS